MWSRSWRLGLETVSRLTNVSSRSRRFASRAQDVILPKLVWIEGTEYCTDFLSLSEQGVYAWSRLHVIVPYKLILCIIIIIIKGRINKVMAAIIITCRPRPILTSRVTSRDLQTSRLRLVSKFERLCLGHPCRSLLLTLFAVRSLQRKWRVFHVTTM